jgi:hypothetical protein
MPVKNSSGPAVWSSAWTSVDGRNSERTLAERRVKDQSQFGGSAIYGGSPEGKGLQFPGRGLGEIRMCVKPTGGGRQGEFSDGGVLSRRAGERGKSAGDLGGGGFGGADEWDV